MSDMTEQLRLILAANDNTPKLAGRFNPRPPGVIREGSASEAVLKALREAKGFKNEAQLRWMTKRSHSAVSWSLLYLIRQGLVEAMPETHRNGRYQRYRAKTEGEMQ